MKSIEIKNDKAQCNIRFGDLVEFNNRTGGRYVVLVTGYPEIGDENFTGVIVWKTGNISFLVGETKTTFITKRFARYDGTIQLQNT